MKARCLNPKHENYSNYGAEGISVCKRWMKFENFLNDMGEPKRGKVLDRKNNRIGYTPKNCRWVTFKKSTENRRNTIFLDGERVFDMAKRLKIPFHRIYHRLKKGWTKLEIEMQPGPLYN